jgi:hypothetical protein
MAWLSDHGSERSLSTKWGAFLVQPSDSQRLQMNCTEVSSLVRFQLLCILYYLERHRQRKGT